MRGEYLVFDLLILAGPVLLAGWRPTYFLDRVRPALLAIAVAAPAFVLWDAAVTGRHWTFNPAYVLPWRVLRLPIEEWLFFLVVPFACLFSWKVVFAPWGGTRWRWPIHVYRFAPALLVLGGVVFLRGLEYTGLVAIALGAVLLVDRASGVRLVQQPRAWAFFAFVQVLTLVFNGYLTARPVVVYDARHQLDVRIGTIPLEDFGFGFALVVLATIVFEVLETQPLRRAIARRLGGYRIVVAEAPAGAASVADRPTRPSVLVVGGGLAGMTSALTLAERGFEVVLHEAKAHLGGKLGAWTHTFADGERQRVEHGFHAFFRQYYNLDALLQRLGARARFAQVRDYEIRTLDRGSFGFASVHPTPGLNLLSLLRTRLLRLRDLIANPKTSQMSAFLEYDPDVTPALWDGVSFAEFARAVDLPRDLQLVFTSFSRAFFAEPADMSMAELIKSFHFYFLSHEHGLRFDHPTDDHALSILGPFARALDAAGVDVRLGSPVATITPATSGFTHEGHRVDYVVLALDVGAAARLLAASPGLARATGTLAADLAAIAPRGRYAVLRLWMDRDTVETPPGFVIVDRPQALDAVTFTHRVEDTARAWAAATGGGIYELHAYAVPAALESDAAIRAALLEDFLAYFPDLRTATILRELLQVGADFTAFRPGLYDRRPAGTTALDGLHLAGDWVRLPCPAMLMEAAVTSALLTCNAICAREGVRGEAVLSVPLRGLLHGRARPTAPARQG